MIKRKKRTLTFAGHIVFGAITVLMIYLAFILLQSTSKMQDVAQGEMLRQQQLLDAIRTEQSDLERQLAEVEYLSNLGSNVPICAPNSTFKSFMDYRNITDETSNQYVLLQRGYTVGTHGILVQDGRFLVAMSEEYGSIGTDLTIDYESVTLRVRIADIKHTGCTSNDGSMIEFLVDSNKVHPIIKETGDFNNLYEGTIKSIRYGD